MKHKKNVSKAQEEVWRWKEKAAESLLAFPPEQWLAVIHARTSPAIQFIRERRKKSTRRVRRVRA
ncbi:MAG: hypothetical protein ACK4Q5_03035 [Saprospiraceae bacterium]